MVGGRAAEMAVPAWRAGQLPGIGEMTRLG
jgi:hypothetical protein